MIESVGQLLAVLGPLGQPGRWLQVALSFLPQIIGGLVVAGALAAFVVWFPRWGVRARAMLAGAVALVVLAASVAVALVPRRPDAANRPPPTGAWNTFMRDPARTGYAGDAPGPLVGKKVWIFREPVARAPFAGSPAVVDGRIFVGCDNQRLYCLDARTGQVLWTFRTAAEVFASPAVADGRVYVGEGLHETCGARLYCLDARDGRKLWEFPTTSHVEFGPTLRDGKVYFGAGDDGVYCVDGGTGQEVWHFTGVHVDASPAVTDDSVFFGSVYGQPAFYRLNRADGREVWRKPAPYGVCGSPSVDGRRVFFGLGNGTFTLSHAQPLGGVYCLSADDGSVAWTSEGVGDSVLTTVALWNGRAYFGSRDGRLYCLDARTGKTQWTFPAGAPVLSSPAIAPVAGGDARAAVYFGCDDGRVRCLDALTGEPVWSFDASAEAFNTDARILSSPAVADGRVYVGSMNFLFFCLGEPAQDR